jgi:hypothetical protein
VNICWRTAGTIKRTTEKVATITRDTATITTIMALRPSKATTMPRGMAAVAESILPAAPTSPRRRGPV